MKDYIVESGDTIQRVAVKFNCTPADIAKENKLFTFQTTLFPGQKLKIPEVNDLLEREKVMLRTTDKPHPGTAARISAPLPTTHSCSFDSESDDLNEKQFVKFKAFRVVDPLKITSRGTLLITPKFLVFDPDRHISEVENDEVITCTEPVYNVGLYIYLDSVFSLNTYSSLYDIFEEKDLQTKPDGSSEIELSNNDLLYLVLKAKPLSDSYTGPPFTRLKMYNQNSDDQLFIFGVPKDKVEEAYSFLIESGIGSSSVPQAANAEQRSVSDSTDKYEDLVISESQSVRSYETSLFFQYYHYKTEDSDSSHDCLSWEMVENSVVANALKEFEEQKFRPQLHNGSSDILSDEMLEDLSMNLPLNVSGSNLYLVYKTGLHGYSLGTIYRKMKSTKPPAVMLIKDSSNTVFGAYMSENFKISTHYYGNGETFVFHWIPDFKKYEWTRENSFFLKGDSNCFAVGAKSGHSAIWIEDTLKYGRSEPTDTFDNPILCGRCKVDQINSDTLNNSINSTDSQTKTGSLKPPEYNFIIDCLEVWRLAM